MASGYALRHLAHQGNANLQNFQDLTGEGLDAAGVSGHAAYVDGFVEGCHMGVFMYLNDELLQKRK